MATIRPHTTSVVVWCVSNRQAIISDYQTTVSPTGQYRHRGKWLQFIKFPG